MKTYANHGDPDYNSKTALGCEADGEPSMHPTSATSGMTGARGCSVADFAARLLLVMLPVCAALAIAAFWMAFRD